VKQLDFRGLVDAAPDVVAVFDREQRYVYVNPALERAVGAPGATLVGKRHDDVLTSADAAMWREALDDVLRTGRARAIECTIAMVRGRRRFAAMITLLPGDLACAVLRDVTDVRAHDASRYLAEAGALLERFDPDTSLQAIVDLAVPVLADWCFIHLRTAGHPAIVAIAHGDPVTLAAVRARAVDSEPLSPDTAVARVLAGGPREIVDVDDAVLAEASRDPAHLEELRRQGYRSAVVAPLAGRDGVLGAVTFAMGDSGRRYHEADLDMLAELARRTGIALDNARLFAAEQDARRHAEAARDRTRRLQALTATLSGLVEKHQVVSVMVDAGRDALGAGAGFAWLVRDAEVLELAGYEHAGKVAGVGGFEVISMAARLPVCDVVRTARPMLFESLTAMTASYPDAVPVADSPFHAWAVIPFVVAGRGLGAVSFAFDRARTFSDDDRELLAAMTGQVSLALERCMLLDAERRARTDAEASRLRERQLNQLAARLSSALTLHQVATIASEDAVAVLRADTAVVSIRSGDEVQIQGIAGRHDPAVLARLAAMPVDAIVPHAEAVRTAALVWCASEAELAVRYPHVDYVWRDRGVRSWGAVPFTFEGRTVGSLGVSFLEERQLSAEEREFLRAIGQLAAQAIERARLYQALQDSEDQLRRALTAARAATWRIDLATMLSTRDSSYQALVGVKDAHAAADFGPIHPDDRDVARVHLERALHDGTPYEPEVRVRRDDGTYMWIRAHGRVTYTAEGVPSVLAGVIVDIDEAKQASLRAEEERRINEAENARLYQTVREQKDQLEIAVEGARLADRRKDEFLAMLGHELRNPLAPIATALELMKLKGHGVLQKERDVIGRQVEHLSRLIGDLLDVSRITRGKIDLDRQVLEIGDVLAKALEMASPLLEKRMQRLVVDVARAGLPVDGDPTRLAQVFQNLLTNAAKYSDPRSQIVLRARGTAEQVIVELSDQGIGIAPDLMPRLFELFAQGSRALDRAEGGLGIGLTIAKSLCELHGGTIQAASAGPGQGSTFTVTLPRAVHAELPVAARAGALVSTIVTGVRVLVVDDNVDAAQLLHEFLSSLGHQAAVAHDGAAALALAGSFHPDVAVLDIGLPVMDGYELARRLRAQRGGDKLRLIAVTGYGQEADRARARAEGFDHHLVKPIALEALMPLLTAQGVRPAG
jgi:PAS domain S-box-containing protein